MKGYSGIEMEFDNEVKKVIEIATAQAVELHHSQVGTGHLLAAICNVAPNSLVVKNLPPEIFDFVRAEMSAGDATNSKPELSKSAVHLIKSGEQVYGDGEFSDETSRCELSRVIFALIRDLGSYVWRKRKSEEVEPSVGVDCALECLSVQVRNMNLLDAFALYEKSYDLDEAMWGLGCKDRVRFLSQVLRTQRFSKPEEVAGELKRIQARSAHSVQDSKDASRRHTQTADTAKGQLETLEAQLKATQAEIQKLNDLLARLAPTGSTDGAVDIGAELLNTQKINLQAESEKLEELIVSTREWLQREQSEADRHARNCIDDEQFHAAIRELMSGFDAVLKKARENAQQKLIAALSRLAKAKENTKP